MSFEVGCILLVCCVYTTILSIGAVLHHHKNTTSGYVVLRRWSWILVVLWAIAAVSATSGSVYFLRFVTTRWLS